MNYSIRLSRRVAALACLLTAAVLAPGCSPTQPFYFFEDGDLSHYVGMATNIEYPDVATCSLQEVNDPPAPFTISNAKFDEAWDLCLADAVRIALENGKVMRSLGVRLFITPNTARTQITQTPELLLGQPQGAVTVYEPAIFESDPIFGPEGALSVYDAQFTSSMFWNRNDRPQNVPPGAGEEIFNRIFTQDLGTFQAGITKNTATGGQFGFTNNTVYDLNNRNVLVRETPSDWTQNFDFSFTQPLLQGAGSYYNRIAGPFNPLRGIGTYLQFDGVVIARIRTDIRLADFEAGVRNFVSDVENAYWELYFAYRNLDATRSGRDAALQTWRNVHAKFVTGARGGDASAEAQAREQYFFFRSSLETAQADVFRAENRLRYMMGLAATDGRLIRPCDEPSDARVLFDWCEIHAEGLCRSVELRQQKWRVKQKELELCASKNLLLPRLDVSGRYRFLGLGDDLIRYPGEPYDPTRNQPIQGTDAFSTLSTGDFQEWEVGLNLNFPIGFRQPLAAVRNQQLQLARERAVLQDQELEVSSQLAEAIRDVDTNYTLAQTNFNRRVAAEQQVEAVNQLYIAGTATLDLLLEAQRRRADAESAYYRAITDYNKAIMNVHFRKGSLLEYNGVYLAEGPWPAKAYFDAKRRARARDAGMYLDYGYTRPAVMSKGPFAQFQHAAGTSEHEGGQPTEAAAEEVMPPEPQPRNVPRMTPPNGRDYLPEPGPTPGQDRMPNADAGSGPRLMSATGRGAAAPANQAGDRRSTLRVSGNGSGGGSTSEATRSDEARNAARNPSSKYPVRQASAELPVDRQSTSDQPFDWGDMALYAPKQKAASAKSKASAATSPAADSTTSTSRWKSPASTEETRATQPAAAEEPPATGWKRASRAL